ncbi:protein argonaute 2-like [Cornus florida]|uniref:protein argonaute 2-like n=1 Tax=Cornus florida TaxID=4283 RepID=UPI00289A938A|nr:protein argonaute 2-like [Cornus florida]
MERGNYSRGGGERGRGGGGRGGGGRGGRDGGGRGGGGRGGGGRGGGRDQHHQQYQNPYHQQQYAGGGGGGGRGRGGGGRASSYGGAYQGSGQEGGYRPAHGQGGAYRPPSGQGVGPARPEFSESSGRGGYGRGSGGGGGGAWGGSSRAWVASVPEQSQSESQRTPEPLPDDVIPDIQSIKISEQRPPSSSISGSTDKKLVPVQRPDKGGRNSIRAVNLLVNHFPVQFNPETIITHYDVDVKPEVTFKGRSEKIPKYKLQMIREKLFSDDPTRFQLAMTAYDGSKSIFSAVSLPTGKFIVDLSEGEDVKRASYIVTINAVNELKFCKLKDYLCGNLSSIPRDVLQGMDVVMKENPSRNRVSLGRSFYPTKFNKEDDLGGGIAAMRGFQQSLKPTSQGLALCLDYSVLAFRKRLPVIDFLKEHLWGFSLNDFRRWRRDVIGVLKDLRVTVTHRVTKQRFKIAGLTDQDTRAITFDEIDPEGTIPPRKTSLVDYFRRKYGKEIIYQDIPCLNLGKNKQNYVPMEFCILLEGQRYPKEDLDKNAGLFLKELSLAKPNIRRNAICEMVRAEDGPCGGNVTENFDIQVVKNMTPVVGRVLGPPDLKLGASSGNVKVDRDKCQWNLVGKKVVDGKPVERWALLDFSSSDRRFALAVDDFIYNLQNRCKNLGIRMNDPLVYRPANMNVFLDARKLRQLLEGVMEEANKVGMGRLQIIVCAMSKKDPGYKFLKWISETDIGIVTQCCLSDRANKRQGQDQYFGNLALKMNAKLGGSNFELLERLPNYFGGNGHVMFIGADVNHPGSYNSTCPSMAAVVATVNWPEANRYAARVCPQDHRKENILNFGSMCLDLVHNYARINKVKPEKIIVFRDGVSESQFDMVLNEEFLEMQREFHKENYYPTITLIVAQKRHQTRLFPVSQRDAGQAGNVPPGTVVDTTVVHPFEYDFYLCSHYGGLGTSKPTHYYVLWDQHNFTSDKLQKLIYDLCFTFARCTKPVSLVPPVYYADLVAYRGRMFQEVVMELYPASVASSSSGMTSSTMASASFDDKFYKLHPELENIMFFV